MKIGTLVAAIVGGLVMFCIGGLVFGFLLGEYFRANTIEYAGLVKDPPLMWLIFLFNVVWAWIIAYVMEYGGRSGVAEGAKIGAILLFAITLGLDIEFEAFMNVHRSFSPMLVQLAIVIVMGAISGAVIGWVVGFFDRRASHATS